MKAIRKQIAQVMHDIYHEVAYDLPKVGHYHWANAVDVCSDWAYDRLNKKMDLTKIKLKPIAKKVVAEYCSNDTTLSKRREEVAEKARTKRAASPKIKKPKVKQWDDFPPNRKRLGISSY